MNGTLGAGPLPLSGELAAGGIGSAVKLTVAICGQTAIIEGAAADVQPHMERFFALAERALEHNINSALRQVELQAMALQLRAVQGPGGSH